MPADRRPPDPAPPDPSAPSGAPVVYAVVPVFNRLSDTLDSLDCLRRQTYRPIEIIVADGGSTDGTPEVLEHRLPGVQVLRTGQGVWWAGAAAAAVDHALRRSTSDHDFVLFLNNDTEFDARYVSQLVEASRTHDACVSGVVVDREPPGQVLEAGVVLDRTGFTFRHRTELTPDVPFWQGTDVLPGYGLLVPVRMLRMIGNLNARRYPHYLADYDLTMRLGRAGFRLGVVSAAAIKVRATNLPLPTGVVSPRRVIVAALHRKSKINVVDRLRFIEDHAAPAEKWRARAAVAGRALRLLALRRAAIDRLGNRYRQGDRVAVNRRRALWYYRLAAALGHANAMNNIGTMYLRGEGVPQDYGRARSWFERATRRGNAYAPDNLARMYRGGCGVERDLERAQRYAMLAAERGFTPARAQTATAERAPAAMPASDSGRDF